MDFIDLKAQYRKLQPAIDQRIHAVLDHGQYIMGPEVSELEQELADFIGARNVITCANGTDAIQLALMALGVGPGDAVFTTTFTFFATAEVIAMLGATPVFVDVDEETYNLCPTSLETKIWQVSAGGRYCPRAIIAVDLFGLPADYGVIGSIASRHGLSLVEDAAQGFGGAIGERMAGTFGLIATTSFFPAKPLGCYGDGGAVFTDDDDLAACIRSLRVHGQGSDKYDNVRIGLNSRLDTIQAAVLLEKLVVNPIERARREQLAALYDAHLPEHVGRPAVPEGYSSAWAQYTVRLERRDEIQAALWEAGIPSMVYYRKCMHQQSAFSSALVAGGEFEVAESLPGRVLSLPIHAGLADEDVTAVCELVRTGR